MEKHSLTTPKRPVRIELDREEDGRWIAEIPNLPGVMAYGMTKSEAVKKVSSIALRTIADSVDNGKRMNYVRRWFEYGVMART